MRECREVLADDLGAEVDLDLRRFLILFLGRLLFATRDDAVHCRFLPLLEDLGQVGDFVWGAAFLAHQFDSLGASERRTSTSGFFPFLQTYLHLPGLRRGILERLGLVPIARHWEPRRDRHTLEDQLASIQDAIDTYPQLDVVWQPYLEEGDEGQPWLVQARPYFGKSVDVAGEIALLRALLHSAVQDREVAQREAEQLWRELDRVGRAAEDGASSSRATEGSQSDLEDRLAAAVRRAEEARAELAEWETELRTATDRATQLQGQVDTVTGERDQLRIRVEAAESRVAEATRELATLRVQRSSVD
ncbi:hypothetical protein Taro_040146 [Colocasia esculenta]|uniref:Aminotransferase-like plant mobile domain-containing protein n=1 Tax=Colocasia esculenta TaxID=4460 RepID=A0A843WKY8_COLES|nr:hypothetical protein [Colocasia esculenta]